MSGGRALQSLIHLRLTKAYAWCSGVHSLLLDRGLDCPWVAIPAPESDISDQVSSLLCAAGARWAVIAPKGLYDTASSEPTWAHMALAGQGCRAAVMTVARQHFFILFAPYITACGLARRPPVHSLAQVLVFGKSHIYHDCVSVMNLIFHVPCLVADQHFSWHASPHLSCPLISIRVQHVKKNSKVVDYPTLAKLYTSIVEYLTLPWSLHRYREKTTIAHNTSIVFKFIIFLSHYCIYYFSLINF